MSALAKPVDHGQVLPPAQATAPAAAPKPDLTLTLSADELWPEPTDCPDWPMYLDANQARANGPRTRQDAEQRLATLAQVLNGESLVHPPSQKERKQLTERYFTAEPLAPGYRGANWSYERLGLPFIRNRAPGGTPDQIVECAHLRGWLRKLDAAAKQQDKAGKDSKKAALKRRLDRFVETAPDRQAELEQLAEAENRHRQRIEDEKAHIRAHELRQALRNGHAEAVAAANELGVEPPPPETRCAEA